MQAFFKPLLILGLVLIVVVGVSWFAFPDWRAQPGGLATLIGGGAVGLVAFAKELLGVLKTWKELEESEKKPPRAPGPTPRKPRQEQAVIGSEDVQQRMKRSGGDQKQTVDKSSNVEQVME